MSSNIMAVNAALSCIASQEEVPEAARFIVDMYHDLQHESSFEVQRNGEEKEDSNVTGTTDELGNVEITERGEKKISGISYGKTPERIGHYRLWRRKDRIYFHHYWASDLSTQGNSAPPTTFVIDFDQKTLNVKGVGTLYGKRLLKVWRFYIDAIKVNFFYKVSKSLTEIDHLTFMYYHIRSV